MLQIWQEFKVAEPSLITQRSINFRQNNEQHLIHAYHRRNTHYWR